MTDYEVTYILRPSLEESEIEERANAIAEIVKGQGGEVTAVERLGKKRLAYEINDSREGNYVVMQFTAGSTVSKELDRQLKLHEDVLRALIIKLDAKMQAVANEFDKCARDGKAADELTGRVWALDQRQLLNTSAWLKSGDETVPAPETEAQLKLEGL